MGWRLVPPHRTVSYYFDILVFVTDLASVLGSCSLSSSASTPCLPQLPLQQQSRHTLPPSQFLRATQGWYVLACAAACASVVF